MPKDEMYLPLQVGHAVNPETGYAGDDVGENISDRNENFCELTGLYWAWKNLNADYIGLVHYRRHFTDKPFVARVGRDRFDCVLTHEELRKILQEYDLVLPKQRRYFVESMYSHFVHLPHGFERDLLTLRAVVAELEPDYLEAFDRCMRRTHMHMFNMIIAKRELLCEYCEWLFPILMETDRRIDVSDYTPMAARAIAFFGEFMFDIWNDRRRIPCKELPVLFMERQNWLRKGGSFLLRWLKGKRINPNIKDAPI